MNVISKTIRILLALVFCMASVANAKLGSTEKIAPNLLSQTAEDNAEPPRELQNKWTAQQKDSPWKGNRGDDCVNWEHQVVKGKKERCNKCKAGRGTIWKVNGMNKLKCGVQPTQPITRPQSKPQTGKDCYKGGTFVPTEDKNRCCNGAQYVNENGYRCKY